MSLVGHSKGKGPLKLYEETKQKDKRTFDWKIGLFVDGYVLARPIQEPDWHLAQIIEKTPLKSI